MEQKIYDIAKQFNDMTHWGDTPLDQIPLWEVRDILSMTGEYNLTLQENELVELIVKRTIKKTPYTWNTDELSIIGEAKIQYLLRAKGYDLKCFDLNTFPTSSTELATHLRQQSIALGVRVVVKEKLRQIYKNISAKIRQITNNLTGHDYIIYGTYIGLIYALTVAPWVLFPIALLVGWVICNCITMTIHEDWVHDLITPRNRLSAFIFNYMGHVLWGIKRIEWRYRHKDHHQIWKTPIDPYISWKDYSGWYIALTNLPFNGPRAKQLSADPAYIEYRRNYLNGLSAYYPKGLKSLTPENQFLEKYDAFILPMTHIAFFLVFGAVNYIYFFLLQCFLFRKYITVFDEIVTHHNDKTREEETDQTHWFPICCGTAYHTTHHQHPTMVVLGPGWMKYVNIQYYFTRLFYKLAPGASFS